jgi:hypothetical protein
MTCPSGLSGRQWFTVQGLESGAITEVEPEIGRVLVPNCIYRCGCPEMTTCGLWGQFMDWCAENHLWYGEVLQNIQARYDTYHEFLAGPEVDE